VVPLQDGAETEGAGLYLGRNTTGPDPTKTAAVTVARAIVGRMNEAYASAR
jgi:hypothetical protein